VDFQKVYDTVEWEFPFVLQKMGNFRKIFSQKSFFSVRLKLENVLENIFWCLARKIFFSVRQRKYFLKLYHLSIYHLLTYKSIKYELVFKSGQTYLISLFPYYHQTLIYFKKYLYEF